MKELKVSTLGQVFDLAEYIGRKFILEASSPSVYTVISVFKTESGQICFYVSSSTTIVFVVKKEACDFITEETTV